MAHHILAVDDDERIRRLIQLNLQRAGYRISTAGDGVEALAMIEQERPDLVVLDITMPRMDGIETLRHLRANAATAALPVVLLSAKAQDEDILEGRRSGADYYLHKPFNPPDLLAVLREVLGEA
jgi:two-component system alkaline phosphatase synthesis response regulator PhoP/two-component system response regulator VicR